MSSTILRPLTLGELLDTAFGLYRRLFVPLLIVTVVTRAVPIAIEVYVDTAGGMFTVPVLSLVNVLLSAVLGAMAAGASTFVVSENCLGHSITAGQALRRTLPYVWPLMVLAVAGSLLVIVGLLVFIVPGLILIAGLALGTPALVLEELSGIEAMGRSWNLTQGYRRKVFGAILAVGLILILPGFALGAYAAVALRGANLEGGTGNMALYLGLSLLTYGLSTLIYPLLYCVLTVAYYDLRVRKEGFDLEVLAQGLQRA